jgi:hypothetical protein
MTYTSISDYVLWRIKNRVERIRLYVVVHRKLSSADEILCGDIYKIYQIMCSEIYRTVKSSSTNQVMCSDIYNRV